MNVAKSKAEAHLTAASAADKGVCYILAPNDGTSRSIADVFAADPDVTAYYVTGQDAEKASVQYIIDGKQSMTVFKDTRVLATDAMNMAVEIIEGKTSDRCFLLQPSHRCSFQAVASNRGDQGQREGSPHRF